MPDKRSSFYPRSSGARIPWPKDDKWEPSGPGRSRQTLVPLLPVAAVWLLLAAGITLVILVWGDEMFRRLPI